MPRKTPDAPVLEQPGKDTALKAEGFQPMSTEALENLMIQDPGRAQQYLDLYQKAKVYRQDQVEREALIKTQIMILKGIQKQAEIEWANQQSCERNSHMREDNRTALVGQKDNNHELLLVCQRCQKHYHGIGDQKGQLPIHLAQTVDMSLIGGVQ